MIRKIRKFLLTLLLAKRDRYTIAACLEISRQRSLLHGNKLRAIYIGRLIELMGTVNSDGEIIYYKKKNMSK